MQDWFRIIYEHHTTPTVTVNVEAMLPSGKLIKGVAEDINILPKFQMVSFYIDDKLYIVHVSCVSFEVSGDKRFNQNKLLYRWKHK